MAAKTATATAADKPPIRFNMDGYPLKNFR
jgi:hypothetical protein